MEGRKKYVTRHNALKEERSSFIPYWRQLSDVILGHKGRHLSTDKSGKIQRNNKVLNNTARLASRTLASGMMSGITSPARPWFRLAPPDSDMLDSAPVREWLHNVEKLMREVFSKSNVYNSLHTMYGELGVFGVSPMGIFPDFKNVIHCQPYTIGSYCLGTDSKNSVNAFYYEFSKTVAQLVDEYGEDKVSERTRNLWRNGGSEKMITCLYLVEPNDNRDAGKPLINVNMPYRVIEMEKDAHDNDGFLKESGSIEFPILAPRWEVVGQDAYATACPAMDALGDVKVLQLQEKRKGQAIDKVVNPPLQAPISMNNLIDGGGFQAGEISFVNDLSNGGIRSVYDMRPDINALAQDIQNNEFRVKRAFYEDLFLMLANSDRRQITAREVEEKHEEKLLMLGGVLERLHNELLDPLIDRTFAIMQRADMLPEPPPELRDSELRVEYISVLAQAQRMTAIGGIDRLTGFVGQLAQVFPEARHKINAEQAVDEYAQALGVSPKMIRDDEEVDEINEAEAAQAERQQQMAMVPDMAKAAKDASEVAVGEESMINKLAGVQ